MTAPTRRRLTTAERVVARTRRMLLAGDPLRALDELHALRADLDRLERALVGRALGGGASFAAVARALGISRQAAHRRYRDHVTRAPASRIALSFTKQAGNVIAARDDLAPGYAAGLGALPGEPRFPLVPRSSESGDGSPVR